MCYWLFFAKMMIVLSERYGINFCTELGLIVYFALLLKGTMNSFFKEFGYWGKSLIFILLELVVTVI